MDRQRLESLRPIAAQLGWTLVTAPFPREGAVAEIIRILNASSQFPRVRNVMSGRAGDADVSVFDFSYVISKYGRRSHTAVCFRSGELKLPPFILSDLGFVGAKILHDPHRNTAHAAMLSKFYQNYRISVLASLSGNLSKTERDRELIGSFITSSIESFYEGRREVGTICLGTHVIYFKKEMVAPHDIPSFINEASEAFELFKTASRRSPIPDATLKEWLAQVEKSLAARKGCIIAALLMMVIPTAVVIASAFAFPEMHPLIVVSLFPVTMFAVAIISLLYFKAKG
jgi:hypothetical protein